MQTITTIGLDIAKSVFQVHGVDNDGKVVIRRQLKRRYVLAFFEKLQPCLVGIEACASSHHWSRELQALGHTVRLMPPAYVKPYVKRQKNDAADAEAICEAVTRTNMRFVPVKTPEQQSGLMLHRTRHLFIRQQTSVINAIRAHLAEFGVTAAVGRKGIEELLRVIADPSDKRVPDVVRACLAALGSQLLSLKKQILDFDRMIMAWHRSNQTSKRLICIPGVGPLLATALVASVADPKTFRSGRNFSAWIGLVPREAEAKQGNLRDPSEMFDTLYMIEAAASYFFRRALEPRKGRKSEQIDQDYRDAAQLAVLAAPFRHSRLSATKILGDPNNPVHFRDDATADELRAEIMKRLEILTSAGLIDLEALPAPSDGMVKRPRPGVDQSGINGK